MDWLAHMEHLQSILKKFDGITASTNNLLIRYFRNSLRPSICTQLDKKDHNLDDWQAVIERAVDIEAKTVYHTPFLV